MRKFRFLLSHAEKTNITPTSCLQRKKLPTPRLCQPLSTHVPVGCAAVVRARRERAPCRGPRVGPGEDDDGQPRAPTPSHPAPAAPCLLGCKSPRLRDLCSSGGTGREPLKCRYLVLSSFYTSSWLTRGLKSLPLLLQKPFLAACLPFCGFPPVLSPLPSSALPCLKFTENMCSLPKRTFWHSHNLLNTVIKIFFSLTWK